MDMILKVKLNYQLLKIRTLMNLGNMILSTLAKTAAKLFHT